MKALPCRRHRVPDNDSSFPLWRITDWDDCHCSLPYLIYKVFSPDERMMFFTSNRAGQWDLYRLDLESEEAVQITGAQGLHAEPGELRNCNVNPATGEVTYCTATHVYAADCATLERRVMATCPAQWAKLDAAPVFSGDGQRYATVYQRPDGKRGIAIGETSGGSLSDVFLWEPEGHVGYLIASPTDQFTLSFCANPDKQNDPTAPDELRARAWRLDPRTGDCRPHILTPPGFRATHQFFGPDGRMYFHKKTVGTWTPTWISSINLDGRDPRDHYGRPDRKLGHSCVSPDGTWLVTDVQESNHNELILVNMKTGEDRTLYWPNSTVTDSNAQTSHVHPTFGFTGRQLAFQSDAAGQCTLFLMTFKNE